MSVLSDVGMLLIANNRSRAYLQRMLHHGLRPSHVLLLTNEGDAVLPGQKPSDVADAGSSADVAKPSTEFKLNEAETLQQSMERAGIAWTVVASSDINSETVISALNNRNESTWIYSGPGGAILKKKLLSIGKRFLHIHPGLVPKYRGSTTIYYSLLNEGKAGASAFFISPEIDHGAVIATREFPPPQDYETIDYLYDPLIRSELLVDVLLSYKNKGSFESREQNEPSDPYYIIHPVLKHVCILNSKKK